MDYSFSKHAKERIHDRNLDQNAISEVITNPDTIIHDSECTQIYQKVITTQETYLYRVFINICKQPPLVITAYKTSKIDKYEH